MTITTMERPAAPIVYTAPPRAGALSLSHMGAEDAWRFCQSLAQSALLPREYRDNPASVLWAMEYGRALGLDVVTTITTIHVINNRPTQSADLMLSRAREAGHRVRVQVGDGQCAVSIWRRDDPDYENRVIWTVADAERARLLPGKPDSNWAKYPRAMLRARAVAECVRSACPEVLHGAIYTAEELGAQVDEAGLPVAPQLQRQQPGPDEWSQAAPAPAPVQQTPPDVVAAGVADVPAESLTPRGRDYLHEAHAAPDAATVRQIWNDAKAEGARPGYLDQIAEVGAGKPGAAKPAPAAGPEGTLPGAPVSPQDRLDALAGLYAAGEAAGLSPDETRRVLAEHCGRALPDATAQDIVACTADLTAAGGAR